MSAASQRGWHGPSYRGAMRDHKESRREQAVERNARTKPERRSTKRRVKRERQSRAEKESA